MSKNNFKKPFNLAVLIILFAIIVISAVWSIYEHYIIKKPMMEVRKANKELREISVDVHFGGFLKTHSLVFNLVKISKPYKITPFICLMEFAKKMNNRRFNMVVLQYRGKTKFILDGLNFNSIGVKASIREIEQLALDFPLMLRNPDNFPAFEEPYGDRQWVIQKKTKNFYKFLFDWYINDWIVKNKRKGKKFDAGKKTLPERKIPDKPDITKFFPSDIPKIDIDNPPEPQKSPDDGVLDIEPEDLNSE